MPRTQASPCIVCDSRNPSTRFVALRPRPSLNSLRRGTRSGRDSGRFFPSLRSRGSAPRFWRSGRSSGKLVARYPLRRERYVIGIETRARDSTLLPSTVSEIGLFGANAIFPRARRVYFYGEGRRALFRAISRAQLLPAAENRCRAASTTSPAIVSACSRCECCAMMDAGYRSARTFRSPIRNRRSIAIASTVR